VGFSAKILADSVTSSGARLTTVEATYCRIIHSEVLTHRMLSRSSASSRAIPVTKLIGRVVEDPFIPEHIGKNQKGMQASEQISEEARKEAVEVWLEARDNAVMNARHMMELGVHKQVVNRIIEPWMWITVIISATEWDNFFALRCHEAAEPHFQKIAGMIREARDASVPRLLGTGQWHLPLVHTEDIHPLMSEFDGAQGRRAAVTLGTIDGERPILNGPDALWFYDRLVRISVGRCARVSYLTHDGKRDPSEDVRLHDDLMTKRPLHASPAEHVALPQITPSWSGNFYGFTQYRKTLLFENVGRAP
jgi:hypothetical protein